MHGTFSARLRPAAVLAILAVAAALTVPAAAVVDQSLPQTSGFQGENGVVADVDRRGGIDRPTVAQRGAVRDLQASARWNGFGTPESLIDFGGFLGSGLGANPVGAARSFLRSNEEVFGLSSAQVDDLEVVAVNPIGKGSAVLLRQRVAGLPAGPEGLVAVSVIDGRIAYVSSSLFSETGGLEAPTLSAEDAVVAAARNVGRSVDTADVDVSGTRGDWTTLQVDGLPGLQVAQLVAVPTADQGVRAGYQTFIQDSQDSLAFTHFVDARTGEVLIRQNETDFLGEPKWDFFEGFPPPDYSTTDTRKTWCWTPAPDCDLVIPQDSLTTPLEWDVDPATGAPSFTTRGNNARSFQKWLTNVGGAVGTVPAASRPDRDYQYAWTNEWLEERCNPDVFFLEDGTTVDTSGNDIDAALANLFTGHNLMHDWSYRLGFTETAWNAQVNNFGRGQLGGDPEQGNAQAGGIVGGPPGFQSRDNANQGTGPDGVPPVTNMFLWQPIPGGFYAPCVDGDYDMSVIGHEYGHMISNRMAGGPMVGLSGNQAGAMGESWSDLMAMEIANELGWVPIGGASPYAIGPYVTGDPHAAIRNYNMSESPLNYSDVGYDFVCNNPACPVLTQVHADGEIWSATNFDIREAMNARYGAGSAAAQIACANGGTPVTSCPGNRRWIQLVFDAWLNMAVGTVSMLDARNAMLAADMVRFGGANQDLLWNAFARRGFGEGAATTGTADADPVPDFTSPHATEGTIEFNPVDENEAPIVGARLFVGDYEARVTPVADTDPGTPLDDTVDLVPGTYDLLAQAPGFGHKRYSVSLNAGQVRAGDVNMPTNLASSANGATITGDGINLTRLIDDTEITNWASLGSNVIGKEVTVRLDPSEASHRIKRIQVSALLRHTIPNEPGGDGGGQSRFSALRQFSISTCRVTDAVDCADDSDFTLVFTSPADAFPSIAPRPRAPELTLRSFNIPDVRASYVKLVVLHNQCTGTPDYQGDQDDDPRNTTDCEDGSVQDDNVRAAELQVFKN